MSEWHPRWDRSLAALEHRGFRLLFFSTVTSGIGTQLHQVANLWQIYALTGSAAQLGFTGLARAIPIILFSLAGGVVADRVERKQLVVFTQAANSVFAVILGVLSATGLVQVWHIYVIVFLNGALTSVSAPARRAMIVGLVPRHHLVNALALNTSVNQTSRIIAPSLAGVLIAMFGLPLAYAMNGLANLVTALALGFVPIKSVPNKPDGSPLHNLLQGLAFIRHRRIILALLATDAAATLFGSYQVLLPVLSAHFDMGPTGFGLLASAPAVGSLIATALVMYLGDFPYKGRVIVSSILVYSVFLVGLALAPWFWLAMIVGAGLGFTDSLQASPRNAAIQLLTPDELRGRVSSFQQMLVTGVPSLGQGLLGSAAGVLGVPMALIIGAICCATSNVSLLSFRRDLRARDFATDIEAEEAAESRSASELVLR